MNDKGIEGCSAIQGVANNMDRRSFLKWSAILGGTAALASGLEACTPKPKEPGATNVELPIERGEWKPAPCKQDNGNCGDCCINFALVNDGVVTRMKTDDTREDNTDNPLRKGCLRGRAFRSYAYGEGRLKYPMKRKSWQPGGGENVNGQLRGIDEWERISWDDALDLAAAEIRRIIDTYGNSAIFDGGQVLNHVGGSVSSYGPISMGALPLVGSLVAGGMQAPGPDRFARLDAKLIVFWSMNSAWSYATSQIYGVQQARQAGAKIIVITPEYNASAVALGAEWIPIRPGTDAAMLIGMAYHMIENNLQDQDFLDRCCIGFDVDHMPDGADKKENFKDYVLGTYDGLSKTPEWASVICGVDPQRIRSLAEEIVNTKPTIIDSNLAAFRTHFGHQFGQALFTVGWMSGNTGIHAGGVGVDYNRGRTNIPIVLGGGSGEPSIPNPLMSTAVVDSLFANASQSPFDTESLSIAHDEIWDAILTGEFTATSRGKIPIDIRMMYLVKPTGSRMDNSSGAVKAIQAMRKLDFVLASDVVLSSKSLYADVVFPDTLQWEMDGYIRGYADFETLVFCDQIIDPLFECKGQEWVERELLARLGGDPDTIHPYSEKQRFFNKMSTATVMDPATGERGPVFTIDQELIDEWGVEGTPQEGTVSIREALTKGSFTVDRSKGDAFETMAEAQSIGFRNDPDANPLKSESGKLEIYCRKLKSALEGFGFDKNVSPIPSYTPPEEGYEDTFSDWENKVKGPYPLQGITPHNLRGSHNSYSNVPWLAKAHPREVTMNILDAEQRGIKKGDTILISSRHGKIVRRVNVNAQLIPGVITIPHGMGLRYDDDLQIDFGGSSQVVLGAHPCGQGIQPFNSLNVQVEKWTGDPLEPDYTWPQRVPIEG
jgi:anaerobic dimethyl sulfoxide reductase subunit A